MTSGENAPDLLIKLRFEGIDRRFSDIVYHLTDEQGLAGIRAEGLRRTTTEVSLEWAEMHRLLLTARPAGINLDLNNVIF